MAEEVPGSERLFRHSSNDRSHRDQKVNWRSRRFSGLPVNQGELKNRRKSRSRRGNEAEVFFAPKSASSRRRLPFLNTPEVGGESMTFDERAEFVEERRGIVRAGRGFRMILHAENRLGLVSHSFDGLIV